MNLMFDSRQAAFLASRTAEIVDKASAIAEFGETDPELAGACGAEICALEARSILSGGGPHRLYRAALSSAESGRPLQVAEADYRMLDRLGQVVRNGALRINALGSQMDEAEKPDGLATLGSIVGLATGAVGLLKELF